MIVLPAWAVPNGAVPSLIDAGGVMRSPINTVALKVNRPGSHYRVALTFAPFEPAEGRVVVSRLLRAKREGLRVPYPLPESQPSGGAPVVDGVGQAGRILNLRNLTPELVLREGWWLSIRATRGQHFLHNIAADAVVTPEGKVSLALSEMLREPFPDGAAIALAEPMIEGIVEGDEMSWHLSVDQLTEIEFAIEEAA